jgi:DNA repair protein RecN (Recombination protein N)
MEPAMLERLHIQNFALIKDIALDFSPQLNVLTGETGAGKSILIDAIRFVLGDRLESGKLNEGTCSVEAVFAPNNEILALPQVAAFLAGEDSVLILRKETTVEGRSRAWINNRSVTNSTLKEIGNCLLDIHGQYDHQLLLDAASHLNLIDRFAKNEELKKHYHTLYSRYDELVERREELAQLEEGREREIDLLKYQIDEIERAELIENEDEELRAEQIRMANSEKLYEIVEKALTFLDGEDSSVSSLLISAFREVNQLARLDSSLDNLRGEYENAQLNVEEVIRSLREYKENLSFEPERLGEVEKRLDLIDLMKRKYGGSVAKVLEYLNEAKAKYDQIANKGLYEKEIDQNIKKLLPELTDLADQLTEKRKKAASSLKRVIELELKDLQIPNARFECEIEKTDFGPQGKDQLEFMVTLNLGQPVLPLRKIISAGEVSRVMLAMKKALMKIDPVATLIFDEIDSNIGGRLGEVTGQKLKEIAAERQVLLITHLPQIASFADRHFKVTKNVKQGKTITEYQILEGEERIKELAQMMSGKKETDISKKHAEEMLKLAQK